MADILASAIYKYTTYFDYFQFFLIELTLNLHS